MSTQEQGGDNYFDDLTTPLNACSLETYFPIPRQDDISGSSSSSSSSDKPSDVPLVIGCYQLNESPQLDSEDLDTCSSSAGSSRCGELRLHMIPTPTSKTEMQFGDAACVLQMESGILDGKWKRRRKINHSEVAIQAETPVFASASASGRIHLHGLEKNESSDSASSWSLNHLVSSEERSDSGLCLAIAWNDHLDGSEDQIVGSYSNGEVAIHQVSYHVDTDQAPTIEEICRWNAHTLFGCPSEVWTCSFLKGAEQVVLSGADDCSMKVWDIRQTQRPIHKIGEREFEAGVTAISSHPCLDNIFAVGSYDEHVRLYDYRKMNEPLNKVSVGGGVWRMKWHPSTWSGESDCCGKLLVAAMHGGCRVVNFPSLNGSLEEYKSNEAEILSEFTAHKSMAYGADWISFVSPEQEAAASCSFYDRKAFIWD